MFNDKLKRKLTMFNEKVFLNVYVKVQMHLSRYQALCKH